MKRSLLLFFIFCYIFGFGQCGVFGLSTPNNYTFCVPGPQTINYTLAEPQSILFEESFNCGAICNPNWVATPSGAIFTGPYLNSPTNDTYFFTSIMTVSIPVFETPSMDLTSYSSGKIDFDFIYADPNGLIDGPDIYDEGIEVQYSINGGFTWQHIVYYAPNGDTIYTPPPYIPSTRIPQDFYNQWNEVSIQIPIGAITANTKFRISQPNRSGACCDHWGIDNFKVLVPLVGYNYYINGILLGTGPYSNSLTANSDSSFNFLLSDGINFCYDTLNVQLSTPDSIFIQNTTPPTSLNALDGTITIGGLSIGSQIAISNSPNPTSFGPFQMSNVLNGLDTGTYYIIGEDLNGCSSNIISTLLIAINNAPIAVDDAVNCNEDSFVFIDVSINDSDIDGNIDVSSISLTSLPAHGVLTLNSSGYNYTPSPNFNGTDTFHYSICDTGLPILCNIAEVLITVFPLNDAPIALSDSETTYQDVNVSFDVLANDADIDTTLNPGSVTTVTQTLNGTTTVDPFTGILEYDPNPYFIGLDSGTYVVCDFGIPFPSLCDTAPFYVNVLPLNIEGTITTSASSALQNSKVYLIDFISASDSVFLVDSTFTDAVGFYQFNVAFQNAYIKAIPDIVNYANQIPTYYSSSSVFTSANSISIPTGIASVSFSTIAGVNPGGNGFISGIVGNGAGKNYEVGEPISNLSILLMNSNNEVVKQIETDVQGYFSFDNLEASEYTLWVDKPSIDNSLAPTISLIENNTREDLQFILHENYLELRNTVSINDIKNSDFRIFPNPSNGQVYIQSKYEDFNIEVYSLLGERVIVETDLEGNVILDLTKNQLSKGTYLIKISNDEEIHYTKIVYR